MDALTDYSYITLLIPVLTLICFCSSNQNDDKELEELRIENKTLKNIILKSFDAAFTNALKNGY